MDSKVDITLPALKFVTGDTDHICRLCFSSTETEETSIEDSTRLQSYYFDKNVTFIQMFQELQVYMESELPQVLCTSCAVMTVNSYLFRKLCQYSNWKWQHVFKEFNTALDKSNIVGPNVKTIYLMINKNENVMYTSKKSLGLKSKTNAICKVRDIIKSRQTYVKLKQQKSNVICEECGQSFKSHCNLVKHMRTHSNTRFPCAHCPKIFASQMQLDEHLERLHYPKRIQCSKCSKRFSTEKMLKCHDKLYHVAAICKLCFVQFPSKRDLRGHLDKHNVNKCPLCQKLFLNKQTYKFHLKICGKSEQRQLSFFCDICSKGYARKNGLRTHLKTDHGFGKVLSCNWCDKKFDAISRLRNHVVKHTKERNYHCNQCGNRFVTQAALLYHTRLHTGEKPFPCDLCNESFLSTSRRMEHKRRKHFGPTKECHICHVKFVTGHQLRKHVPRHYNPKSKLFVPKAGEFLNCDPPILNGEEYMNVHSSLISL